LLSGAIHAEAGEREAARQSLLRATMISPLHVVAQVARRPSALGWMARGWLGA
jgi:hypothetical protein